MKFIIFSDPHIEDYVGQNRLANCLSSIEDMFVAASEVNGHILCAGDLIDKASALKSHVVTALYEKFKQCFYTYPEVRFFAISGNHDMTKRFGEQDTSILNLFDSAFPLFKHLTTFHRLGNILILGIPFHDKRETFLERLENAKDTAFRVFKSNNPTTILLTHQSDPATPFADLFVDDVKDFDYVFNGHIHRYKQHSDNFWTVGNPLWRNAADTGDRKGYLILDTDTKKVERVFLNYPEHISTNMPIQAAQSMYIAPAALSNTELFDEFCIFAKIDAATIEAGKSFM